MGYTAKELIKIAEAEVGYLEKKSNSNLDSKTGNAGYNNYTKYARDLYNAGYYNGNKNGYAWCDVFVDWLFYQLCNKDAKKAQSMICQSGPLGAGCYYSMGYYKSAGRFFYTPKVGDQIFFGAGGDAEHTGVVYAVDSSYVYTIEGNTSSASGVVANGGGVFKKSYSRNYYKIVGYGRPYYDEDAGNTEEVAPQAKEEFEVAKTYYNGSTSEPVYADTAKTKKIGSLNPYESCDCLGKAGNMYIVRYKVDGTNTYKVGVVAYHGGC